MLEAAELYTSEITPTLPFVITWWQARGYGDEADFRRAELLTLEEAQEYLELVELDFANDWIKCSWLDPEPVDCSLDEILF